MRQAKKLFNELRYEIIKALVAKEFLNAAMLFFALLIPLSLMSMSFLYALIPTALFFVIKLYRAFKDNTIQKLEQGNPEVHELLHTAYEHQEVDSLMVQGLMYDLQKKLATVSTGVLIDPRRAIGKVFVIAILALIPLAIYTVTPSLIQANPLADIDFSALAMRGERFFLEQTTPVNLSEEGISYGDINLALLGEDELELALRSSAGAMDSSNEQELREREFAQGRVSGEIEVVESEYDSSARVYDESEVALITRYSCKQRGDC
ncbi:MAG: hypothetical protein ACMXYD_00415 [Candidatus Woesearchaeota archaeon]